MQGDSYQDNQRDESGNIRKVWMFLLKPIVDTVVNKNDIESYKKAQQKKAEKLSYSELEKGQGKFF